MLLKKLFSLLGRDPLRELEEREMDLLDAGVSFWALEKLKEGLSDKDLQGALKDILMDGRVSDERIFLLVGTNGSGKTTTAAKMAAYFMERGERVVVAAADTFRAGSIEQLEELSKEVGFKLVKKGYGVDPAAVAYEAVREEGKVIIDTAGRQEVRIDLMEQLKKIKRVAKPDLTLYVTDATQGLSSVEQARGFDREVGIDGFVVTKLDVDERGGVILSLCAELQKPVYFVSWGQGIREFGPFDKESYIKRLLED